MNCNKKYDCLNCEMLDKNVHILFVDDRNPFNEVRVDINGFHCCYTGKYDVDCPSLKRGGFLDDIVYASDHKIVVDYLKMYDLGNIR